MKITSKQKVRAETFNDFGHADQTSHVRIPNDDKIGNKMDKIQLSEGKGHLELFRILNENHIEAKSDARPENLNHFG